MPRWKAVLGALALGAASVRGLSADSLDPLEAERRLRERASPIEPLPDPDSGITRDAGSIAVIEHDGSGYAWKDPDGAPNYAARAAVARRFYRAHGDSYDFLVVFTGFEFDTGASLAFFNPVRNNVAGIGRPPVDVGSFFGSAGRLTGYVDMAALDRYRTAGRSLRPGDPGFLTTLNVAAHQIAHQWLAQVRYRDASGSLSRDLLGDGGAHWSYLLDSGASLLYGADWVDSGGGTFKAARVQATFSPLDLYLMGFLEAGSVPAFTLLRNPGEDPTRPPVAEATVSATAETVAVDQVIAAEGTRSPSHLQSPKSFRAGFLFLAAPGQPPSGEDLEGVEMVRQALAGHFFALTRGAAVLETALVDAPAPPGPPSPDLDKALAWLLAQQAIDGRWQDSPATAIRDTAEVLGALARAGQHGLPHARGRLWANGTAPANSDFAARRALGLSTGSLAEADRAALAAAIVAGQNADGGFGPAPGFESDGLDTALALRALHALGRPLDAAARAAVAALGTLRLESGGWGIAGAATSAIVTAHAVLALQDWSASPEAASLAAGGVSALLAARNPDGGFGQSPSTTYATALVLQALDRAAAPREILDPPTEWLQRTQRADGSWEGSTYQTALVLAALRASVAPNLVVPPDGLVIDPPSPTEGETARVTAAVRNVGRAASPPTVARLFDGDPAAGALVGEATVAGLEPGMEAAVSFDYPTAGRAGRRTVFVVADAGGTVAEAREDDNATSRAVLVQGLLPDLVVTPGDVVASPDIAEEGETVRIDVTVRNLGQRSANPSLLRLVRGDPRQGGTLVGEAPVPPLPVGEGVTLTFAWHTSGALGANTLYAVADAAFAVDEEDETNGEAGVGVEVVTAAPAGPELEAVSLRLEPSEIARIPQTVGLEAVIRNRGRERALSTVALYDADPPAGASVFSWAVDLPPRSSTTLSTSTAVEEPGDRTFVVVADPQGTLEESDEDNNRATALLRDPNNTIDLEVLPGDVTLSSSDVVIGEEIEVTVVLHNRGTVFCPVTPLILGRATADGVIELVRSEQSVSEDGAETVTLRWKSSLVGDAVPLVVQADPFGQVAEVSETNNRVDLTVRVQPSALPNLTVSEGDITFSPDPLLEGGSATVSAVVRNPSPVSAGPFVVSVSHFGAGDAGGSETLIGEVALPGLGALSSVTASVTWSPVEVRGTRGVRVAVDALATVEEYDEEDNQAERSLGILGLPDLVLSTAEVTLAPPFPRLGEAVAVTATIRNQGAQPAPASVVRAFEGELGSGAIVGDVSVPGLAPGESAVIELSWIPAPPAGDRLFSLLADPDNALPEQDKGNNLARKTVVVQDSDLFLTEVYFSPDGDGVKDETTLSYRVSVPVTVVISDAGGRTVRTLPGEPSASASATWDGRDAAGRIVPDGRYALTLAGEQGATAGRTTAVVDTNRASLFDAAGTAPFRIRADPCNLACDGVSPPAWMPAEDAVLVFQPGFPPSILKVTLGGEETTIPLAGFGGEPFFGGRFDTAYAVAPDGRDVLITTGESGRQLFIASLATGEVRSLGTVPEGTCRWSPDGRFISTPSRIIDRLGNEIVPLPDRGSAWEWSPDGERLASGNAVIRSDGTDLREFTLPVNEVESPHFPATVWRSDGRIYLEIAQCAGCGKSWAGLIDPATSEVTEIPWLADNRISNVSWSADATRVAYQTAESFPSVTKVSLADGSGTVTLASSPLFMALRASAAAGISDACLNMVTSVQNLTAAFRAVPLPGDVGVRITATVTDQNLDYHQLEYATQAQPDAWHPLGPASDVPFLDEDMTVWVPPAPGAYLLRLRAYDRAGNRRHPTQVVSWRPVGLALPPLADITQTEFLISPDGDGTKDAVTFHYRVLAPTTVDVRVTGPKRDFSDEAPGPTVEQFALTYTAADIGAASFLWEGLGARDGRYTVFFNGLPFRVDVDTTAPEIAFSYQAARIELDPGGRAAHLVAQRAWHVFDEHLAEWKASGGERAHAGTVGVYQALRDPSGTIVMGPALPAPQRDASGRIQGRIEPDKLVLWLGTDDTATFTATDRAGNRATVPIAPVEQKLYLLEGWPSGCRPSLLPPIDSEAVYPFKPDSLFNLAETIRGPGDELLHFEYQENDGGAWTAAPPTKAVSGLFNYLSDFDAMGLVRGRTYRGRFATASGFVSESFKFFTYSPSCTTYVKLEVKPGAPQADPTREEFLLDLKAVGPNPVVFNDAYLNVVTNQDGQAKAFSVRPTGGPVSVVVPRPTCDPDSPVDLSFSAVLSPADLEALGAGACLDLSADRPSCSSSIQVGQTFVPCGEGTPGSVSVDVNGFSDGPATATVLAGLQELASFGVTGTFSRRVVVDTTGLGEGESDLVAELRGASGVQARNRGTLVIDRTPPTASILLPADGAAVCAPADEAGRERVTIEAEAVDLSPVSVLRREFRAGAGEWSPWYCPPELGGSPDGTCPETGFKSGIPQPLVWDVTGQPAGDHAVCLTFCDRAGHQQSAERRFRFVKDPPAVLVAGISRPFFSPNGDGLADDTRVTVRSFQALRFTAEVHRGFAGGERVRTLVADQGLPEGESVFTWDGFDGGGLPAAEGEYALVVVATDGCGRSAQASARLRVDLTPPTAMVTLPQAGSTIATTQDIRGTAADLSFAAYELAFGAGTDPPEWTTLVEGPYPVMAGVLGRWTTPPVAGPHTLRLTVRDKAENRAEAKVPVEVTSRTFLSLSDVAPSPFSPNGDGRRDGTTITYALQARGRVFVEIRDAEGRAVRRLEEGVLREDGPAYTVPWDGLTDAPGTIVDDGEYFAWIRVEDPLGGGASQEESLGVSVDRTAPSVIVGRPAPGAALHHDQTVRGSVEDLALAEYVITAAPAVGPGVELGRGNQSRTDALLAALSALADGAYTLEVAAEDAAGNRTTHRAAFTIDSVSPRALIEVPGLGAVVKRDAPPVAIRGAVTDDGLLESVVRVGPGAAPAYFDEIARSTTGGDGIVLGTWPVASLADGSYTLQLEATDRAENRTEVLRTVSLDGTPPVAEILVPADGSYVNAVPAVDASATDLHFESWRLDSAAGPPATPFPWSPVASGTSEVRGTSLGPWATPPDGQYTLRLTATDQAGNTSVSYSTISVDTVPPDAPPTGLGAVVQGNDEPVALTSAKGSSLVPFLSAADASSALFAAADPRLRVRLTWTASPAADVAGYRVLRNDTLITPERLEATTFTDEDLSEGGVLRYAVVAEDLAGNRGPAATITVRADVTPPEADILEPTAGSPLLGPVTIRGTAYSPVDFGRYRLFVSDDPEATSWTLLRQSALPVVAGVLGEWTAAGEGGRTLKLEAEDISGNVAVTTVAVAIDNVPPVVPTLRSVAEIPPSSAQVVVEWDRSNSDDVAGYLLYRGGRLVNAGGFELDELRRYLLLPTSHADSDLPDGRHCYRVVAMDLAGNLSLPSAELCATVDNHAPHAVLVQPPAGTRFDTPIRLLAASSDEDVASVLFEIRPADGDWTALGAADMGIPFETMLDPQALGLAAGDYELRAVATDEGGRTDGEPEATSVRFADTRPPAAPEGLAARVTADTVELTWRPVTEADVVAYVVYRDGERIEDVGDAVAFTDQGLDPGEHEYLVAAVDREGNESPASNRVLALVYRLSLDGRYPVTPETEVTLAGTGAQPETTIEVRRDGALAAAAPAAGGRFEVPSVPLMPGGNVLQAQGVDAEANRSIPSEEQVLISIAPPPAVTGLSTAVTGHDVDLAWEAVTDAELQGYRVRRGEVLLTGSAPHTEAASVAATAAYTAFTCDTAGCGLYTFSAPLAFDGDTSTAWIAAESPSTSTWTVTFPSPVLVEQVSLSFASASFFTRTVFPTAAPGYRIAAHWNDRYVPLVQVTGNTETSVQHVLPAPFATTSLQVTLDLLALQGLAEVGITAADVVPAGTPSLRDAGVPDGRHSYRVTAMDRYGAEGPAAVKLVPVGDVTAPAAPTGLASSVGGSDVLLSWTASPEADFDHYAVLRDGTVVITTSSASHVDAARPNGVYRYTVKAADHVGNESDESAPAHAGVSVTPPPAPVLSGAPAPSGAVDLAWTHPGAAQFAVSRSAVAGGPYTGIAGTGDVRSFSDPTAARGQTHHYVVRALDTAGNESDFSNEVMVTPERTDPVAVPVILFPTDAEHPLTLGGRQSDVRGRAELGSEVSVHVNGRLAGTDTATLNFVEAGGATLPGDAFGVSFSASGAKLAYATFEEGAYRGHVLTVATGEDVVVSRPDYEEIYNLVLSPDGTRVAYTAIGYDPTVGQFRQDFFVRDLASGADTPLEDGPEAARELTWSSSGDRIAYVVVDAAFELRVRDLITGQVSAHGDLADFVLFPRFSPDGGRLAFLGYVTASARYELRTLDLASGATATVDVGVLGGYAPSWSPDGRRLAYSQVLGTLAAVVRDLSTGERVEVRDSGAETFDLRFDPAGAWRSFQTSRTDDLGNVRLAVVAEEAATGERREVSRNPMPGAAHEWLSDGRVVLHGAGRVAFFPAHKEAAFQVADIRLDAGENVLVARSTVAPEGLSTDSDPVRVTVPAALYPDLAIMTGTTATDPLVPVVGGPTVLWTQVRNVGGIAAANVAVSFSVTGPHGTEVFRRVVGLPQMAVGQRAVASAHWTPLVPGAYLLGIQVDPTDLVHESSEDDNVASLAFSVVAASGLAADVQMDRDAYAAQSPALARVRLVNGGAAPFQGRVETWVEGAAGERVVRLDSRAVSLAYGRKAEFSVGWSTGRTYAGDYRVHVMATDGDGVPSAAAVDGFRIAPDLSAAARLVADRSQVPAGQTATFAARLENRSLNAPAEGYTAHLRILPGAGGAAVFESTAAVPRILPGGLWQATLSWSEVAVLGHYRAELRVVRGSEAPLAVAEAPFAVVDPGIAVAGTVVLRPPHVLAGETFDSDITVVNLGPSPLAALPLVVDLVFGPAQTLVARSTLTVDLDPGETHAATVRLSTAGMVPDGGYLVFLRTTTAPAAVLATGTLRVHGLVVPPTADSPADGARVATLRPTLAVNNGSAPDGLPLTYAFQVFADAALTNQVAGVTGLVEGSGRTSWTIPSGTAEDQTYYWRARASDGFSVSAWSAITSFLVDTHNSVPLSPMPDRPLPGERVASSQPLLTVRNATDQEFEPLRYDFRVAADAQVGTVLASAAGVAEEQGTTSWRVPVTLAENTTYYWSARARDGEGEDRASPWTPAIAFFVDTTNEPPGIPRLIRPVGGVAVASLAPELVVETVTDPESDPVRYEFQIDATDTFGSAALQVASDVSGGGGQATWTPPAALTDNTLYYWRARAGDGRTASAWSDTTSFFVNLANDPPSAPELVDPVDGRVVATPTPNLTARNATDVDRDPLTYEFVVRDAGGTVVATASGVPQGASETIWTVEPPLAEDGVFEWSAHAHDGSVAGPASTPATFRVNAVLEPPTAPSLVAPPEGAVVDSRRVALVVANARSPEGLALTYEFELYREAVGEAALVERIADVPEGAATTSWTPAAELADGPHGWRARASDGTRVGPWMASAHFSVQIDVPPAAPTGLQAVPGNATVALAWDESPEPDVVGYRVHRSTTSGGPYAPVAAPSSPAFEDTGLANGTTYYYVVTALDTRFESEHSSEAAATPTAPPPGVVTAEVRFDPSAIDGQCLLPGEDDDGDEVDHGRGRAPGRGHDDGDEGCRIPYPCPEWIYATLELPDGLDPSAVDPHTVRLGGSVRADERYLSLTDVDADGVKEARVRFAFQAVRELLAPATNTLTVTGRAGVAEFRGAASVQVSPIAVEMKFTPQALSGQSKGNDVQAELSFCGGAKAGDVAMSSLRLNDHVPARRVEGSSPHTLRVKFSRAAVQAILPRGSAVEVRVTGTVRGIPFQGRDVIRVIE